MCLLRVPLLAPRLALLLAGLLVALTACSGGTPVARDTAPTAVPAPPTASPTPTAPPTVGTYPDFAPEDYTFTLEVSCFCPDMGPIRVAVVGGDVTTATYLPGGSRGSVEPGSSAPDYRRLSIDDVIDAANDTEAAHVDVIWPAGQDYPTSVYVDRDENTADEEIGYAVTDVVVTTP